MNATHADLTEGERTDVTVEFVTRRTIDNRGKRVHRLLVDDESGDRFAILVAPDSGLLAGLKTGESYRFSGLLASRPGVKEPAEAAGLDDADGTADAFACPECSADLRRGVVADAVDPVLTTAVSALGITERFGIVDEHTTVRRADAAGTVVDDWQPMQTGDQRVAAPDFACPTCGRRVDSHELRNDEPAAERSGMEHSAGQQIESVSMNAMASPDTVGLAAGGATDVTSFRENVESGYTPQPEAISDEGLFYDYYFETGEGVDTDALFAPRYAAAASEHPISGEVEQFLSVGLDSTLAVEDFQRPDLDLVAVLDVSGSMDSPFDAYYYDEHGRQRKAETDTTTKLAAATQSLCALTEQLRDDDRLGVVLYNHRAHVAKPLRDVGATDMNAIRRHIQDVSAGGSTNLADGFEAAAEMLTDDSNREGVERRVVFMTDMMPNAGATGEGGLTRLFADAADAGIHTTFVGMGLDENAELADALSGIRGANHYFVQSAAEFERRLGEEFDYMVTPLVYDLSLELDGDGYEIAAVHGSPTASDATRRLMHVETLFPSAKQDGEARGGVVLVELERTTTQRDSNLNLSLVASWTERDGSEHTERVDVAVPDEPGTYAHSGIRKAVALARYAAELRAWARDVHERAATADGVDDWLLPDARGEHERESVPLVVPGEYANRFDAMRAHLEAAMDAVGDDSLRQELDLLETLCWEQPTRPTEVPE